MKIELYGYGGEICIGRIEEDIYERVISDKSFDIFYDEIDWSEIDDIFHFFMLEAEGFNMNIFDGNKKNKKLRYKDFNEKIKYHSIEFDYPYDIADNDYMLFTYSYEKGHFSDIELNLKDFEIKNLLILGLDFSEWGYTDFVWKMFYGENIEEFIEKIEDLKYREFMEIYSGLLNKFKIQEINLYENDSDTLGKGIYHSIYSNGEYVDINED